MNRSRSWLFVAVAALGAAAPGLWPGRTLAWRDAASFTAPSRGLVAQALRAGHLPLWNPFEGLGRPLFAEGIHSVLHPVSVLAALLVPGLGTDALAAGWLIAAAVGAWVLARQFGASGAAATAAGFAYGLSGYVVGQTGIPTYLAGAASLPWVLAAARSRARHRGSLLAIAVMCLAFSGDFQALAAALPLAVALAFEGDRWRGTAHACLGIGVGLMLAALQLWPSWVHVERTVRAMGVPEHLRDVWALAPFRLLELICPGLFRGASPEMMDPVFRALSGTPDFSLPFAASVFIGAPVLLLAAVGAREKGRGWVLGGAALVFLWLALGRRAGSESLLHFIPVLGQFRYAEKWIGPFTLCASALCALGVDRVAESGVPRWLLRAAGATLGVSALCAVLFLGLPDAGRAILSNAGRWADLARARLGLGAAYAAGSLIAAWALVRLWPARGPAPRARLAGLILAQSALMVPAAVYVGRSADFLDPRPPALEADGPVRLETPVEAWRSKSGPDAISQNARIRGELGCPAFNVAAGVDNVSLYTSIEPLRLHFLTDGMAGDSWRGFRRFAATHLLVPADAPRASPVLTAIEGATDLGVQGEVRVFALPHRPWAFFAERVGSAKGRVQSLADTLERLRAGDPTVTLESDRAPPVAPGRVIGYERKADQLRVDAEASGEGVLVINDAFWPGWEAEVDGRSVPIWPADFLVRAVPFPAGRHQLSMRYRPTEVRQGFELGALGLALLAALLAFERKAPRPV